jgi:LPS sulfotransferase NodH
MTGIADLYLMVKEPHSKQARDRFIALIRKITWTNRYEHNRFVVLSWKRTGSNLLCGILFNHPEIVMHNELFNPVDIFSYYNNSLVRTKEGERWQTLGRDLYPEAFMEHIWTARDISGNLIKDGTKAVGFKSFPDHWWEPKNDLVFERKIMEDCQVKKVVLFREDELAVYVSMKRAEETGIYMTHCYPKDLKINVDPAAFQVFVNNYRDAFHRRYKSTMQGQDTFRVSYEQLVDEDNFKETILPLLWDFLGVDNTVPLKKLRETVKQADSNEDLSAVIENYDELEFCFRHTDVKHFKVRRDLGQIEVSQRAVSATASTSLRQKLHKDRKSFEAAQMHPTGKGEPLGSGTADPNIASLDDCRKNCSWSILLPLCSRSQRSTAVVSKDWDNQGNQGFNANRLHHLAVSCQYERDNENQCDTSEECWKRLEAFATSLRKTSSPSLLSQTECIVGIDEDDPIFRPRMQRIIEMLPCAVKFVDIKPTMYGRVCRIWNHLGKFAKNDFVILLGDDVILETPGWQSFVADKFFDISQLKGLPFGAGCVALNDESFPGFPTFPVVHRWHINQFKTVLPRQFVNQGGDPYLFEVYSRFGAAAFVADCRLRNTIGGDNYARYKKHEINWKGQILRLNLLLLSKYLKTRPTGICVDIVIPTYRTNNDKILESILRLKSSMHAYVKFWLVVDNPDENHLLQVKSLADKINRERFAVEGNYFITVLHYGENRGASYARNFGFNYSTADWALFIDDDVVPGEHLLDAYLGAIRRYPNARVFVGNTELPRATNIWTKMLRTCNIMFFYGISKHVTFPPWGVTANLLVRGSRHNNTIQFKSAYPKTGGGEDIDLCFQFKQWYQKSSKDRIIVGVPGATASHPWWNGGNSCYRQINGWAWGDSLCIAEWPEKCFWAFPNWIEFIAFIIPAYSITVQASLVASLAATFLVFLAEHALLTGKYYSSACRHVQSSFWVKLFVAFGAGTILSFQEATRLVAHLYRGHFHCICRRVDWNDGQEPIVKLDTQLASALRFAVFVAVTHWCTSAFRN